MYSVNQLLEKYKATELAREDIYMVNETEPITLSGGNDLTKCFLHPYFPDKKVIGFELVKPFPHFNMGVIYLLQSGGSDGDYIISNKGMSRYTISECFEFPEYFKPAY
jgi:hypothetical protein